MFVDLKPRVDQKLVADLLVGEALGHRRIAGLLPQHRDVAWLRRRDAERLYRLHHVRARNLQQLLAQEVLLLAERCTEHRRFGVRFVEVVLCFEESRERVLDTVRELQRVGRPPRFERHEVLVQNAGEHKRLRHGLFHARPLARALDRRTELFENRKHRDGGRDQRRLGYVAGLIEDAVRVPRDHERSKEDAHVDFLGLPRCRVVLHAFSRHNTDTVQNELHDLDAPRVAQLRRQVGEWQRLGDSRGHAQLCAVLRELARAKPLHLDRAMQQRALVGRRGALALGITTTTTTTTTTITIASGAATAATAQALQHHRSAPRATQKPSWCESM
jgi:hypothetical protein